MTQLELVNLALAKLGSQSLASYPDTTSTAGRAVAVHWNIVRDSLQSRHRWRFCWTPATVTARPDGEDDFPPPYGYTASYEAPADCLRVLVVERVDSVVGDTDWREADGIIYHKRATGDIRIEYIRKMEDVSTWSAGFCMVFAYHLAAEIAETLTQSTSKRVELLKDAERVFSEFRGVDIIGGGLPPVIMPWERRIDMTAQAGLAG